MKFTLTIALISLLMFASSGLVAAQSRQGKEEFSVARIQPYDRVVPGQIVELLVQGLGGADTVTGLSPKDFRITVSQDGVKQQASARTATPMMFGENPKGGPANAEPEMRPYQNVTFVVPRGLHTGEVELVLSYRRRSSAPVKLTIVDHPMRPILATVTIETINPSALSQSTGTVTVSNSAAWKLERGTKARFHLQPLMDPENPNVGVVVQFKQGDASFDALARVVHQSEKVETQGNMVSFFPDSDFLEVEIPAGLRMGAAQVSVRLRANGQVGEAESAQVEITDASRAPEAPAMNAPQLLAVTPRKVGAGQALMISVDHARTLEPDPAKTLILFEQGSARYMVQAEMNSAVIHPGGNRDESVFMIARPTRQIIGATKIRIFNSLRSEQTGTSQPVEIEISDEVLPPEITSVAEATSADLAPLRQMYEAQHTAGRQFQEYDPNRRYLTINGTGLDPNPHFLRIRLQQGEKSATLSYPDFSFYSNDRLIVRLPEDFQEGSTILSVENRGAESYSAPVKKTFELRRPH